MDPERYYKYSDLGTIDQPRGGRDIATSLKASDDRFDTLGASDSGEGANHGQDGAYAADLSSSGGEISQEPVALVYSLGNLSVKRPGAVLAAGFGNTLKSIVKAANSFEVKPLFTTGTDDKLRAFSFGNTTTAISLGKKFDERHFSNEFALLQAADTVNARTVLWSQNAAPSDLLIAECDARDILILCPHKDDKTSTLWFKPEVSDSNRAFYEERFENGGKTQWRRCPHCGFSHDNHEVVENKWHCPTCGDLYRLTSDERIGITFDEGTFEEWDTDVEETNPLDFPEFDSIIERAKKRSGYEEGVRCGVGEIKGQKVAAAIMESSFMMGSMGSVVGEKITRMFERATDEGLAAIVFCASGGARMQEGLASLMQMAKVSAAVEKHDRAGNLFISVLTDPTTGGVTASFATLGDIILSEPHALIGFAGRRVIQDTIKQALPDDFQTAEFALEHGLIDAIVDRCDMKDVLFQILSMHDKADLSAMGQTCVVSRMIDPSGKLVSMIQDDASGDSASDEEMKTHADLIPDPALSAKGFVKGLSGLIDSLGKSLSTQVSNATLWRAVRNKGVADLPHMKPMSTNQDDKAYANHAWDSVKLARNAHRPTSLYYISALIDDFIELHGDRAYADDGAIVGGIGRINGLPVTIIAEEKGADLKSRVARNFGSPQPEGYRKAQRLMKQADKFGRPIICFVDTQGAFCGKEAEERGMGNAIAESLELMAGLGVPVISVVIGEGGSGGALALAVGNRVAMQENAVYSVLSPEGFASILWKDGSRAPEAAGVMKMSASDALEMGMIEDIIPEGHHPAHENPEEAAAALWLYITNALDELVTKSPDELRAQRYDRFRAF